MAKSLQNILNDVVGEILQENEGAVPVMSLPKDGGELLGGQSKLIAAPNTTVDTSGIEVGAGGLAALQKEQDARAADGAVAELPKSQAGFNEVLKNRFLAGMNNPRVAETVGVPGSSPIPQQGFFDQVKGMAADAKNSIGEFWDARTTPEKVGIGALMAAPLAAGAGALYLRKKQREANKAAGVR